MLIYDWFTYRFFSVRPAVPGDGERRENRNMFQRLLGGRQVKDLTSQNSLAFDKLSKGSKEGNTLFNDALNTF